MSTIGVDDASDDVRDDASDDVRDDASDNAIDNASDGAGNGWDSSVGEVCRDTGLTYDMAAQLLHDSTVQDAVAMYHRKRDQLESWFGDLPNNGCHLLLVNARLDVQQALTSYMDGINEIERSVESDMNDVRQVFIQNNFDVAATIDQVREGHVANFVLIHHSDARTARNYLMRNYWNISRANVEYMLHSGEVASMPMNIKTCTLCIEEIQPNGRHRGVRICGSEGCSSNHTICFQCANRIRSKNRCPWCQGAMASF